MKLSEEVRQTLFVHQHPQAHIEWADRIATLEQELAEAQSFADNPPCMMPDGGDCCPQYPKLNQERDQLRQAVKQFVEEMDAQFPKLEMLPGEYDTLAELVKK